MLQLAAAADTLSCSQLRPRSSGQHQQSVPLQERVTGISRYTTPFTTVLVPNPLLTQPQNESQYPIVYHYYGRKLLDTGGEGAAQHLSCVCPLARSQLPAPSASTRISCTCCACPAGISRHADKAAADKNLKQHLLFF